MKPSRRAFVQWFLLLLSYIVGGYFAWQLGIVDYVWTHDFTRMTSVISSVTVLMVLFLGVASFKIETDPIMANSITVLGRSVAYIVTLIGLLGTAIGLMYQVGELAHVNVGDAANLTGFIGSVAGSLSSALLSTAVGIVASIGITTMNSNAEFFLDVKSEGVVQ